MASHDRTCLSADTGNTEVCTARLPNWEFALGLFIEPGNGLRFGCRAIGHIYDVGRILVSVHADDAP